MMVTSSFDMVSLIYIVYRPSMCTLCRRCHHHTIYCIQNANRSYIQNLGPSFCVLRCGIALILGHKTQVLYFVYRTC